MITGKEWRKIKLKLQNGTGKQRSKVTQKHKIISDGFIRVAPTLKKTWLKQLSGIAKRRNKATQTPSIVSAFVVKMVMA